MILKITCSAWRLVFALLAGFLLVSCGGGGGSGGGAPTGGTVAVQGVLSLPTGDNATQYTVFNSNQGSTPSSTGNFSTLVAKDIPTYTYAISDTGNKVYASVNTGADGSVTINAQSTAEAMVLLNPLLIPRTSVERSQIIDIVKADAAVKSLATVIETVYGSVTDPMSDTRISDALTSAVSSVLQSWQALKSSSAIALALRPVAQKGFLLGLASCSNFCGSSPLQIINNDMGALTLANSSGSTLKLELNNVGTGGITTNIDWVVRIVELDPAKIQWTQYGGVQLQNPTLIDVDSLIKSGGYDQKTIIEGAVGSGLLKFIVDPIGKVANTFGDIVFPDTGIILPNDGVYAVIALSGSPYGDSTEYSSVQSSVWQASYSAEAASINIGSAAIDVIGVGTTFINASTGVDIDISPVLQLELGAIKSELTNNPGYISSTYLVGKIADLTENLLDFLKPYINSSISNLQVTGWKKFFHIAVNTATSVVNVWSGTVSASTRVANYIYNVTPRESGYAILGTYTVAPDTTPPSVPSGLTTTALSSSQINLTWAASTDDVGVAGYNIYRNGSFAASQTTLSYSDTGLSPSTQYCYTVSAFDAAGNVSGQNSQQCTTTLALPAAPTGINAAAGDTQATISWSAVAGVTYNLYMASVSGVTKSNYSSLTDGMQHVGVTSPYTHSGLANGTTYYFVVTAVDANGESAESSQVSVTPQSSYFVSTGSMSTPRLGQTATLLQSGKVLIVGGDNSANTAPYLYTAELYDPATGTFSLTGNMSTGRSGHTATLLANGKVLVTGGMDAWLTDHTLSSAEIFDPATGLFTPTGNMTEKRIWHTATLLANGTVLIAGGSKIVSGVTTYLNSAEIYDPASGAFTPTGSMNTPRIWFSATLMNGGVLVAGGSQQDGGTLASTEWFDPGSGTFTTGANFLITPRLTNFDTTVLPNNNVLFIGGSNFVNGGTNLSSVELYDAATGTISSTGNLNIARSGASTTLLSNGKVLVAGGNNGTFLNSAEIFDPVSATSSLISSTMNSVRYNHTATKLLNGSVLIVGGQIAQGTVNSITSSAELYVSPP